MKKLKEKILFVCLGNICRSPAAEGVLRKMAEDRKMGALLEIDSAGTYGGHAGEPSDSRMRATAYNRGYQLTHRSRQIVTSDFNYFDRIIVMDNSNYRNVARIAPKNASAKIEMFCSYCNYHPQYQEVPDPYYGGEKGFELVIDLMEDGCSAILDTISV